jgi:hypothetical protein
MPCSSEGHIASIFRIKEKSCKKQPGSTWHLLLMVSCLAYSLTLKMEAVCSSEKSRCLQTMQHYNPEEHALQNCYHLITTYQRLRYNIIARHTDSYLPVYTQKIAVLTFIPMQISNLIWRYCDF